MVLFPGSALVSEMKRSDDRLVVRRCERRGVQQVEAVAAQRLRELHVGGLREVGAPVPAEDDARLVRARRRRGDLECDAADVLLARRQHPEVVAAEVDEPAFAVVRFVVDERRIGAVRERDGRERGPARDINRKRKKRSPDEYLFHSIFPFVIVQTRTSLPFDGAKRQSFSLFAPVNQTVP